MPTYEYECKACGKTFEAFQKMSDEPLKTCTYCKKKSIRRKIGAGAGIIFKGSGFYCTDYRKESYKSDQRSDSKPAEVKSSPESKSVETKKKT
ncbi:MAG TPA: FmdB family transcriptional regulator [Lentisphaeria bacterium]|nr:MAG: FmdB family transcriptional regulator [Lentisphaerae bacterium GWF2_49_21]HBC86846.1 FmdB family transcriptional regulator [Lentisphaeria bacterium]